MEPSAPIVLKNATARKADATLRPASAMKETAHLAGQGQTVSDPVMMASMACSVPRSVDFAKEGNRAIRRLVNAKSARLAISGDFVRTSAN
jgi:hypothetical protein